MNDRDAIAQAQSIIIRIAADLANRKWLLSEWKDDHPGAISHAVLRKIAAQNEAARLAAIELRQAFDMLSPLRAGHAARGDEARDAARYRAAIAAMTKREG